MHFLKSKAFWLTVTHLGLLGASIGGAILFPPLVPIIIASQAAASGLIPSPIGVKSGTTNSVPPSTP